MTASVENRVAPRLSFQLPGRWLALDPRDHDAASQRVEEAVRETVGAADDAAIARRRLQANLMSAVAAASEADAQALFLCLEIAPGVAVPAVLTVHAPRGMRMSPAVGTSAEAVLETLRQSFCTLGRPGADTATRLNGPRASMLRLERLTEQVVDQNGESAVATRLEVEYWYAVPGSKQVVMALFATPIGELRNAMRNLSDSIALAASFGPEAG